MQKLFTFQTRIGPFYIARSADGRYHPVYQDQDLGSYATPRQAAEDLAGGHTYSIGRGIDPARLGIPEDVSEWERV